MAKVAFLGLGVMGGPMAGHLAKKGGHDVTVYNRTTPKAEAWVTTYGGAFAATPRQAVEGAEIVFACVGNDDDLRSVVLGDDGALAGMAGQRMVEIEALAFIRGRSIARRFFILDEAQQLTPHEAKTIITRISEGSKIVLIGDPAQIDNPYVDSRSNGLVYCHNRMKGQLIAAHVKVVKGERSRLAELAADLL